MITCDFICGKAMPNENSSSTNLTESSSFKIYEIKKAWTLTFKELLQLTWISPFHEAFNSRPLRSVLSLTCTWTISLQTETCDLFTHGEISTLNNSFIINSVVCVTTSRGKWRHDTTINNQLKAKITKWGYVGENDKVYSSIVNKSWPLCRVS